MAEKRKREDDEVVRTAILHGKRDIRIEDRPPPPAVRCRPSLRVARRRSLCRLLLLELTVGAIAAAACGHGPHHQA
jgi:hypothetical protein